MLHAVIMAGGSGTFLGPYPGSVPKQCLALGTQEALIVETSRRLSSLIDENIIASWLGNASNHVVLFPSWHDDQFIWEPCAGIPPLALVSLPRSSTIKTLMLSSRYCLRPSYRRPDCVLKP